MKINCNGEIGMHGDLIWTDCDGSFHREDGPAHITSSGDKYWYKHGLHHRVGGPAIEYVNYPQAESWWENGLRHRLDGPSIINRYGQWWFINGTEYTEKEFKEYTLIKQLAGIK